MPSAQYPMPSRKCLRAAIPTIKASVALKAMMTVKRVGTWATMTPHVSLATAYNQRTAPR